MPEDKIESCLMDARMDVEGMEKHSLHNSAFGTIYHADKINDPELIQAARSYLIRVFTEKSGE